MSEHEALASMRAMAGKNQISASYLGLGYSDCLTPPVIQRNVLENPGWYTAYTPYQAEIAQGRLEALLNFQTMVIDLTGLEIANASLLDEGTAAAEAMADVVRRPWQDGHGDVSSSRRVPSADDRGREDPRSRPRCPRSSSVTGVHSASAPRSSARSCSTRRPRAVYDYRAFCERAHGAGALVTVGTDLMSLLLLTPPGEWGADVCVGNSPAVRRAARLRRSARGVLRHARGVQAQCPGALSASRATRWESGVSYGAANARAAHPPREGDEQYLHGAGAAGQDGRHVRRLSRPRGAPEIASRSTHCGDAGRRASSQLGYTLVNDDFFDTICVEIERQPATDVIGAPRPTNQLRRLATARVDHWRSTRRRRPRIWTSSYTIFATAWGERRRSRTRPDSIRRTTSAFARTTAYLTHPVFNRTTPRPRCCAT